MKKDHLLILVVLGLCCTFGLLFLSVQAAPIFSYCILAMFALTLAFVATEGWFTHAANEFENRFWSGI
jgi:uncharacterized membrane protein